MSAAAATTIPDVADRFVVEGYEIGHTTIRLSYRGPFGRFTEQIEMPIPVVRDEATHMLCLVLAVAAATSYLKLAPTDVVELPSDDPALIAFASALYDHGLREYRFRNGLDLGVPPAVVGRARPPTSESSFVSGASLDTPPRSEVAPSLLAIGGGKDSALTLALVSPAVAACINPSPAVSHLCAVAGVSLLAVRRTLDSRLAEATAGGGLNGHIPVTAINSAVLALLCHLGGYGEVVFANERSAEEPTRVVGDVAVNHQWSKSLAFERLFAELVEPAGVSYSSLTRGLSDIGVAARVVPHASLLGEFLSCNRAYRLADIDAGVDNRGSWCTECDKCAFTFLIFALFLEPDHMITVFGRDMLALSSNVELFSRLTTLGDKPFDCVGEIEESSAAFAYLASTTAWGGHAVVQAVAALGAVATSPISSFVELGPDLLDARLRRAVAGASIAALVR